MNLKQLKLTNGEEVLCDVVEELEEELVVRHALRLFKIELNAYTSYYTFRPWMILKEDVEDLVVINPMHIVGACNPSDQLIDQYEVALQSFLDGEEGDDGEEKFKEFFEKDESDPYGDLDSNSNVISLFQVDKDKLH